MAIKKSEVALFCYSAEDVNKGLSSSIKENSFKHSKLDGLLCQRWEHAMSSGIFRYDLSDVVTRPIPGHFGFIVQRNSKRRTHRRTPAKMLSLQQPYDPTVFNFNLINDKEVLFRVCYEEEIEGVSRGEELRGTEDNYHMMIVNVSPITYGHTLLVPSPNSHLPQVLTEESIRLCLDMVALSQHSGFSIVANSLLAYASVNHLHYHILYVEEPVLASRVTGRHIGGCAYVLTDHPSPGFGFQVVDSTAACARELFGVVSVLLNCDVPHNMVILRGKSYSVTYSPHDLVIRALLIPRKPHHSEKGSGSKPPPLSAAACELAQGFVPVLDDSKYPTLTQQDILDILREMMCSEEEFQTLLDKVKSLYKTNTKTTS